MASLLCDFVVVLNDVAKQRRWNWILTFLEKPGTRVNKAVSVSFTQNPSH